MTSAYYSAGALARCCVGAAARRATTTTSRSYTYLAAQTTRWFTFEQQGEQRRRYQHRREYVRGSTLLRMSAADNNITGELIDSMKTNIKEALEAETVEVADLSRNAKHIAIKVVSEQFEGKSVVNRQRMVYKAIWMELQDQVHAVNEMITNTPSEEEASSNGGNNK